MPGSLVLAAVIVALSGCRDSGPAKDFKLIPLDDQARSVSLADFKGKTVLLDFWATWCGPCNQAMPEIQDVWNKFHSKGLEVVSISNEDRKTLLAFHRAKPFTFPVYQDPGGAAGVDYGVATFPQFFIIRDGQVIWHDEGYLQGELTQAVRSLMG